MKGHFSETADLVWIQAPALCAHCAQTLCLCSTAQILERGTIAPAKFLKSSQKIILSRLFWLISYDTAATLI